ncbi:MAG: hypothetical protein ABI824_16525 [Acidobacteriota bacterium]
MFDIDQEHPEYSGRKTAWKKYRDLYIGGEQLKAHAEEYLVRRHREPAEVYGERLSRVFYENYIGSIVDWYAATLFRREPVLTFTGNSDPAKAFFSELVEDVDRKGTSLADFFRQQFVEGMVAGTSYVLVDFPRVFSQAQTRAAEDASGASRAYLVGYSADEVINWSLDDHGSFEWVVIRTQSMKKSNVEDAEWRVETRWSYYDKQNFRIYCREDAKSEIQAVDEGQHGLAKLQQVPLFDLRISPGLWMLNRAGTLQLEHFNKSNALSWALTMGLFAMPVVYSDREWSQIVGESYYIQLAPGDRFGWTEPEGRVYQIANDNLVRLQEEIYRVCYVRQAGASLDAGARASGVSKERDASFTQEVLRAYGDAIKEQIRRVLRAIEAAREDTLQVSVMGLDEFDIADLSTELQEAKDLLALGPVSPTLKKEILKKLSLKYLCDARQDVKDRIVEELEAA